MSFLKCSFLRALSSCLEGTLLYILKAADRFPRREIPAELRLFRWSSEEDFGASDVRRTTFDWSSQQDTYFLMVPRTRARTLPFECLIACSADRFGHEDVVAGNFGGHVLSERSGAGFDVTEVAIKSGKGRARADNAEVDRNTASFAEEILGGIH